jgi:WD40 repeat protein
MAIEKEIVSTQVPTILTMETNLATREPISIIENTPTPIPTNANIPTQIPTQEVNTVTPLPVLPEVSNQIKLPEWIAEPSANILFLGQAETESMLLYNLDNHEQYEVPIKIYDFAHWQWQELEGLYLLNLDGSESHQKAINILTGDFVKPPAVNADVISPDGRYSVPEFLQGDDLELLTIVDHELGIETQLYNPFHEYVTRDEYFIESAMASWSPDGKLLSVQFEKHYYSDNIDEHLAIYTLSGEIYRQQSNFHPYPSSLNTWSPILPYRIIYTDHRSIVPPCIFEVAENKKICLEKINEWADIRDVITFGYQWSPDGEKISFVYENSDKPESGLCYYDLVTENIECPIKTNDLKLDEQMYARKVYWSPDSKYMVLIFDDIGMADVIGNANIAIIDVDNQSFQVLEGEYTWPYSNPWRPTIPEPIDK